MRFRGPSAGRIAVEDVGLQRVRVLVLVDEDVVELLGQLRPGLRRGRECFPEQEQVVVVERLLRPLALGVGAQDLADAVDVVGAPRIVPSDHVVELAPGVHHPGMDLSERLLPREAPLLLRVPELVAQQVQHVGCVGLVEHGESGRQTERPAMDPKQPVGDRVECAAPDAVGVAMPTGLGCPLEHLAGCAPAEGQQQQPLGSNTPVEQLSDTGRQGGCFPRAGSGHDE